MKLTARFLLLLVVLASVPIAFLFPIGCSGQGEGERCDIHADNNGKDDCAGDLLCTPGGQLNGSNNTDRCCPSDRTTATTIVCQLPAAGGIDAAPPIDAGQDAPATTDGPVADAPVSDAPPTDAPSDSPVDAPVDAPEDGG
jgi:hypothetical protein